ncbi:DNA translocase FtsK [Bacillus sp. DTU_2020_1000418_1_SI_GHA_SEK_038]|uniref:DNA translocase FtsK n=1 Tax=Bacillus sp. DTU_2020_1000418_1_SI_GHA_SEK_038 TaxID=3077585 RepID=UPI0039778BC3
MTQDHRDRSDINNQKETSKDVNAKVVYQYPKGQFRFPLIPDEKHGSKQREPRLRKEEGGQASRTPDHRVKRDESMIQEKKVHTVKEKREVPQRKGPFRPTETPSPIYGFERPKTIEPIKRTKQVKVKHELSSITYDDIKNKLSSVRKPVKDHFNPVNEPLSEDKEILEETNLFRENRHAAEVPHTDNSYEVEANKELEIESKLEYDQEIKIEELELILNSIEQGINLEEIHEDNKELEVGSMLENAHEIMIDEKKETNPISDKQEKTLDEIHEDNKELEVGSMLENAHEIKIDEKKETNPISDEQEKTLDEIDEDEMEEMQPVVQEITTEAVREEISITSREIEAEEKDKSSSTRKHIPFNVIMLKNDKQKLANQVRPFAPPKREEVVDHAEKEIVSATQEAAPAAEKEEELAYYQFPAKSLLLSPVHQEESSDWFIEQKELLNSTLKNFNVHAHVVNVTQGPSVTRFEVQPEPGVKVNKITNLSDDIKLSLAARDIRIEAPIPGKHTIGIEVPNKTSRPVFISEIINSPEFHNSSSPLTAVLGLDIAGNPIVTDLRKMPHGLIAGATGSGKSVCINTILVSLLYKATPDELKLILIDPKMVELAPYNRIPHLVSPVITDVKAATAALKWAVDEMERRYELFAHTGVRDISRFNELAEEHKRYSDKLPYMVIIIDELADLMMMSPADVEEAICRIAQKARACGIHLIIATQRPSVDVITGLIKANVPTRIAFSVSSQIDSRTIIDISGAEKLLGRGDMLFLENGSSKPVRLQGTYVSDQEIDDVVAHVRRERDPEYLFEQEELLKKAQVIEEEDELFYEACEFVIDQGAASTSSLQRRFKVGYNRAARLIDMMEKQGFISETRGSKPREVLITAEELESLLDSSTIN